jgi:uncharacterized Rmd1/YagE family protein
MAEVLKEHLHQEHGTKLEWTIIILIGIEIALSLINHIEKAFGIY